MNSSLHFLFFQAYIQYSIPVLPTMALFSVAVLRTFYDLDIRILETFQNLVEKL